jgi:UDPglucose--hexose-1-phosphate uridylyltransferase
MEQQTPPEIYALRQPGTQPNTPGWKVRVIPNLYPALVIESPLKRQGEGMYDRMDGVGAHEVIVETPDHTSSLADLGLDAFHNIVRTYSERVTDLARDERFQYVLIFKNHGPAAGASLEHSHSQLIATPVVPKLVNEELVGSRQYWDFHERCIFCDILKQELETNKRVVRANEHFVALAPYAPRFPYETWILSRRHFGIFWEMNDAEYLSLAAILRDSLRLITKALDQPDYNFAVHIAPLRMAGIEYYHFHFEIMPKKTVIAGFEWGSGFFINPVSPEEAAECLKEASCVLES